LSEKEGLFNFILLLGLKVEEGTKALFSVGEAVGSVNGGVFDLMWD